MADLPKAGALCWMCKFSNGTGPANVHICPMCVNCEDFEPYEDNSHLDRLSRSFAMLSEYLRSVSHDYDISFKNDSERRWLIVRVTKGFLYKEFTLEYSHLSDERYIIDAIKGTIQAIDIALNP